MNTIKICIDFITYLFINKNIFAQLVKQDLRSRYLGSSVGVLWAFIQPITMILIFWFVFQIGFKAQPVNDVPFIVWLTSGLIPWFFFSESLLGATNSITGNSYLVNKITFRVSTLPVIKIMSTLIIHLFFILFLFLMFMMFNISFSIYIFQIFYYLFALVMLLLGLSWLTSSLVIFLKDIEQLVAIVIQFGFWLTPIFWNIDMVPKQYHYLLKLNPIFYIVQGYRETFLYKTWFWEHSILTPYFWLVTLFFLILGGTIFRRLRPHFSDTL